MDDILGLSRPKATGDVQRIKLLAKDIIGISTDATLMVSELHCHEEGCPDVETVLAVLSNGDRKTWKIGKPMSEVGPEDIFRLTEKT